MGKFKVGDKVRYHDENVSGIGVVHGLARDGVYLVNVETKDLDWAYYVKNTCREFAERNLTPVSTWQPKVGDRVRYSGKSTIYSEAKLVGLEGVVTNVGTELATVKWDKEVVSGIRTGGDKYITNFEPIATLTIEAGKFYKTRDGRKVGPIVVAQGAGKPWPWKESSGTYYYKEDGHSCPGYAHGHKDEDDLIAEWVDEPAAPLAKASNDNADPTKPKFKIGDRVRALVSWGDVEEGKIYTVPHIDEDGEVWFTPNGDGGWNDYLTDNELELVTPAAPANPAIVCLIENGQPKPSTYPHVHADEGAASKEASRLASVHKGQKFGVYVLTQTVSEEKVYAHEWQNLAANGNKIGAIKALRQFASLDLLSAKNAVEVFVEKAA